jgi:hypothetical protein
MSPILLFLLLCIPLRISLAIFSQIIPPKYLVYFGAVMLIMSFSFFYLYFSNKRLNSPEAGGVTWWKDYRLIIGMFYLVAGIYSVQGKQKLVWIPLAMDVVFGLLIFFKRHFF